jgi:hypothetical protein
LSPLIHYCIPWYPPLLSSLPVHRLYPLPPLPVSMTHNDRVFVSASVVATLGFLRGGEFTSSKSSLRLMLCGNQATVLSFVGCSTVTVAVPLPKNRWWLPFVAVACFRPGLGCLMDPAWLVTSMRHHPCLPLSSARLFSLFLSSSTPSPSSPSSFRSSPSSPSSPCSPPIPLLPPASPTPPLFPWLLCGRLP